MYGLRETAVPTKGYCIRCLIKLRLSADNNRPSINFNQSHNVYFTSKPRLI
jgi:hypothetical protein